MEGGPHAVKDASFLARVEASRRHPSDRIAGGLSASHRKLLFRFCPQFPRFLRSHQVVASGGRRRAGLPSTALGVRADRCPSPLLRHTLSCLLWHPAWNFPFLSFDILPACGYVSHSDGSHYIQQCFCLFN